jgi:hypothetical protein
LNGGADRDDHRDDDRDDDHRVAVVVANFNKTLFLTLSAASFAVWKAKPQVLLTCHRHRGKTATGRFLPLADWKPDSTQVVIATTDGCVILYRTERERQRGSPKNICLQKDSKKPGLKRESADLLQDDDIPGIHVTEGTRLRVGVSKVRTLLAVREEIYVATADGYIHR